MCKQIQSLSWNSHICIIERHVLKKMREYLIKRQLIKTRKSGTYSRLLQRHRKKWQLANDNSVKNEQSEPLLEYDARVVIENQCKESLAQAPIDIDEDFPDNSNENLIDVNNNGKMPNYVCLFYWY